MYDFFVNVLFNAKHLSIDFFFFHTLVYNLIIDSKYCIWVLTPVSIDNEENPKPSKFK